MHAKYFTKSIPTGLQAKSQFPLWLQDCLYYKSALLFHSLQKFKNNSMAEEYCTLQAVILFKIAPPMCCAWSANEIQIELIRSFIVIRPFLLRGLYFQCHSNLKVALNLYIHCPYVWTIPSVNLSGWSQDHMVHAAYLLFTVSPFYWPLMDQHTKTHSGFES